MKSWRTTTLGVICILIGLANVRWNLKYIPFNSAQLLPYWTTPLVCFAAGWGLLHARDHNYKDKP